MQDSWRPGRSRHLEAEVLTRFRLFEGGLNLCQWSKGFCPWWNLTLLIIINWGVRGSHWVDFLPLCSLVDAANSLSWGSCGLNALDVLQLLDHSPMALSSLWWMSLRGLCYNFFPISRILSCLCSMPPLFLLCSSIRGDWLLPTCLSISFCALYCSSLVLPCSTGLSHSLVTSLMVTTFPLPSTIVLRPTT